MRRVIIDTHDLSHNAFGGFPGRQQSAWQAACNRLCSSLLLWKGLPTLQATEQAA